MATEVTLNGKRYLTRGDITRIPLAEFLTHVPTTGEQTRATQRGHRSWPFRDPHYGLGLRHIDSDVPQHLGFIADADANIEQGVITLPHLAESVYLGAAVPNTGPTTVKPVAIGENRSGAGSRTYVVITEGGTSSGVALGGSGLTVTRQAVANVAHTYTGNNHAEWTDGEVLFTHGAIIVKTSGGDTLTQQAFTGAEAPSAARMVATYGARAYILESTGEISRSDAASYVNYTTAGVVVPPGSGVTGLIGYPDEAGGEAVFAFTREAVWLCDASGNVTLMYEHGESSQWNGHEPTVWGGVLYWTSGENVIGFYWENGFPRYILVGPNHPHRKGIPVHGLPSYRRGQCTALTSSATHLYIAMAGTAASNYGNVIRWDGEQFDSVYIHASDNVILSSLAITSDADGNPSDLIVALYSSLDIATNHDSALPLRVLRRILNSPINDTSVKCKSTGYIAYPNCDFGLVESSSGIISLFLGGEVGSSPIAWSSTKTVRPYYATNGAAADAPQTQARYTVLGAAITAGNTSRAFGTNGEGIEARTLQLRCDLANGSTYSIASSKQIAGTGATDATEGGATAWVNPTRVNADDALYTTATDGGAGSTSNALVASGFDFSGIPATATITGIAVEFQMKSSVGTVTHNFLKLRKTSASVGSSRHTDLVAPTTSDQTMYAGGSDALWGTTWTVAEVQASTFGIKYVADLAVNAVAHIDYVKITVFYTNHSGTLTDTPGLDYPVLLYRKKPSVRYGYLLAIDIAASAVGMSRNSETVIDELETVMESQIGVTFSYSKVGLTTTKYVYPVPLEKLPITETAGGSQNNSGPREGVFYVYVEDM